MNSFGLFVKIRFDLQKKLRLGNVPFDLLRRMIEYGM